MKKYMVFLALILSILLSIYTAASAEVYPWVYTPSVEVDPWVNPRAYEQYGSDVKVIYINVFQFGFNVKAVQMGNVEIIYPTELTSSIIKLKQGDKVVFRVKSYDVTHGIYIFGYMPPPSEVVYPVAPGDVVEVGPITFDKPGKFKIKDPVPCDALNPFDYADLIVEPNKPYHMLLAATFAVFVFTLAYVSIGFENRMLGVPLNRELDLLSLPLIGGILRRIVRWRGTTFLLQFVNLAVFIFIIVVGLIGNPTGGENFSITVVWILWFAMVEFMIFFAGRLWCTMCPMPVLGEWLARRRIVEVPKVRKWFSLNKEWPKSLDNMWISALSFLGISLIIVWLTTRPVITSLLFILLIMLGLILHLYNPRRYFCRSICPANGYIGYHANASIFSVRAKDRAVCLRHRYKDCVNGNPTGYGCPWGLYPGGNDENTYCGQCFECFRSCPLNNMTIKLRMVGKDLANIARRAKDRYDEAWMGFIRFTTAIFYELVFFGPYFVLKDWGDMHRAWGANLKSAGVLIPTIHDLADWFKWAIIVSGIALILFPAIFYAFSWCANRFAKSDLPTKRVFLAFSYSLAPYGLLIWMSFAISLLLINWVRPINSFIDPFGLGWNLLPMKKIPWHPLMPDKLVFIQAPFVLFGLALAINSTYNIARELFKDHRKALKATTVMSILHWIAAIVVVWVMAG